MQYPAQVVKLGPCILSSQQRGRAYRSNLVLQDSLIFENALRTFDWLWLEKIVPNFLNPRCR
jgi:hypothetical protein